MTHPDSEIERLLKTSFDEQARQAPHVDLAESAVRHAGHIRRRRRITVGVAGLALVVAAVPIGVQLAESTDNAPTATSPTEELLPVLEPVAVSIDDLAAGPAPGIAYLDGNTFHGGRSTQHLSRSDRQRVDAVEVDDGVLVFEKDDMGRLNYVPYPSVGSTLPTATQTSNPAVDSEDGSVAFSVRSPDPDGDRGKSDTLVLTRSVEAPEATKSAGSMKVQQVLGVKRGEIVFNARDRGDRVVGRVQALSDDSVVEQPWPDVVTVTAIDPDFTRLSAVLDTAAGGRTACASMLDYDDAEEEWESCTWRPVEFSTDGSRVLAIYSRTDGLGPNQVAVLEASDGEVVQQFATEGTFGRLTFEDADTVVGVVSIDGESAVVRCTVGGDCETATDPAEVVDGDPDSMVEPYQVTAN